MKSRKDEIEAEWAFVSPLFGEDDSNFHDMQSIDSLSCDTDIYIRSFKKSITEAQVSILNEFVDNYELYKTKLYEQFKNKLTKTGNTNKENILNNKLNLEIIDIPQLNKDFDIALICSVDYKRLYFFKASIILRIELKNRKIKSVRKTSSSDSINENKNYGL